MEQQYKPFLRYRVENLPSVLRGEEIIGHRLQYPRGHSRAVVRYCNFAKAVEQTLCAHEVHKGHITPAGRSWDPEVHFDEDTIKMRDEWLNSPNAQSLHNLQVAMGHELTKHHEAVKSRTLQVLHSLHAGRGEGVK